MKEIMRKFNKCETLTDNELKIAITHFEKLTELLAEHGDIYRLTWLDANDKLMTFKSMQTARKQFADK